MRFLIRSNDVISYVYNSKRWHEICLWRTSFLNNFTKYTRRPANVRRIVIELYSYLINSIVNVKRSSFEHT